MNCKLVKAVDVQCRQHKDKKSPKDFVIHCNGRYGNTENVKPKNICDFVDVRYLDDNEKELNQIAQIISIFNFVSKEKDPPCNKFFLLICWMKPSQKKSVLPYGAYEYHFYSSKQLYTSIVSIETLYRPAFLVPYIGQLSFIVVKY